MIRLRRNRPELISADDARREMHERGAATYGIPVGLYAAWAKAWADSPESEEIGMVEWAIRRAVDNDPGA